MTAHDLSDVPGLSEAIVAADRAVGERKNLLLVGPPGSGATMIARRILTIMAPLTDHEKRWLAAEYDGANFSSWLPLAAERPFRAPHHTVSVAGLVGALAPPLSCGHASHPYSLPRMPSLRAGEVHLARFGVLFLDEIAEFAKASIMALGSRLAEMGERAPLVVASAPPCPCGWYGPRSDRACACTQGARDRYDAVVNYAADKLRLAIRARVARLYPRGGAAGSEVQS